MLFDELESRLKGSPDQDLIKDLFQGFLSLSVVLPAALSRRCSPRSPRAVLCCCESVISMVPESALCVCLLCCQGVIAAFLHQLHVSVAPV